MNRKTDAYPIKVGDAVLMEPPIIIETEKGYEAQFTLRIRNYPKPGQTETITRSTPCNGAKSKEEALKWFECFWPMAFS
ncbi:MAG: hypothetical protein ABIG30_01775 [Candidatus Aenigmatarchaeota archaeon]